MGGSNVAFVIALSHLFLWDNSLYHHHPSFLLSSCLHVRALSLGRRDIRALDGKCSCRSCVSAFLSARCSLDLFFHNSLSGNEMGVLANRALAAAMEGNITLIDM